MLTEPERILHINDDDAEVIQGACGRYAKRTVANGRFVVTRVQPKRLVSLMYWVKDQRRLRETTDIFNDTDEITLSTMIKEANKKESRILPNYASIVHEQQKNDLQIRFISPIRSYNRSMSSTAIKPDHTSESFYVNQNWTVTLIQQLQVETAPYCITQKYHMTWRRFQTRTSQ